MSDNRSDDDESDHYYDDDDSDEQRGYGDKLPDRNDQEYFMLHRRRGKALIFNFLTFENSLYHMRIGSTKDVEKVSNTLSHLGFDVETYSDLKLDALKSILQRVACEDHSDADCLCVVVMTHGHEHGKLTASDRGFEVSDIWSPFTADKCKTLAGKPKLFFVQACRGSKQDAGLYVEHSVGKINRSASESTTYKIPTCSDILLAFSSARGFSSVRDLEKGSWFIQCLCDELRASSGKHHLLTILTFVCRKVAVDYQTTYGEKQMPTIVSMLTRLVYFNSLDNNKYPVAKKNWTKDYCRRHRTSRKRS